MEMKNIFQKTEIKKKMYVGLVGELVKGLRIASK